MDAREETMRSAGQEAAEAMRAVLQALEDMQMEREQAVQEAQWEYDRAEEQVNFAETRGDIIEIQTAEFVANEKWQALLKAKEAL
jgi:hypothetical protein